MEGIYIVICNIEGFLHSWIKLCIWKIANTDDNIIKHDLVKLFCVVLNCCITSHTDIFNDWIHRAKNR